MCICIFSSKIFFQFGRILVDTIMADAQNSPHVGGGRKSWRDSGRLDPDVLSSLTIMDEDVELLTLSHFTKPPRLDFGTVKLGKTKCCKLNVHNPEEFEQEVVLERFASKKGFKLDQVNKIHIIFNFVLSFQIVRVTVISFMLHQCTFMIIMLVVILIMSDFNFS